MCTSLRARIYHAENPQDQPDPGIVAGKITAMLGADVADGKTIVDLSG
jgi:hypothetical protein